MDDFEDVDATQDSLQPNQRTRAIRPVTIRQLSQTQIKEAELIMRAEPRYSLNGKEFVFATFVGNIVDIAVPGENTRTIRIEDGTGTITSTHTIKKEEEAEDPPKWRVGTYARVLGVPRKFKGAVMFTIYFIRPVEDPHEVFFHFMEAMVVTLQHSRGRPPPRLYDSRFAEATGSALPPSPARPGLTIPTRPLTSNPPQSQSQPPPIASTSRVDSEPPEDTEDSVEQDPLGTVDVGTTAIQDTSDDGGSTEYYTDPPPGSPLEYSPSPTPVHPLARNHSFEGHLDREEGPSSQLSQSTQRPNARSDDEESEGGQTPCKGKSKSRRRDDAVLESPMLGSDRELDDLRSEFSSDILPFTPPRKLKPDPYAGWSPAKRKIMVLFGSKTPGEEVNVRRAMGEGTPKLEMRNAIRELVKEGEIETADGMSYRLADKGPKYPRF